MLSLFSFHLFGLGGLGQLDQESWEARESLALWLQGEENKIWCGKVQGRGRRTTELLSEHPNVFRSRSVVIARWKKTRFGLFPSNYITHALEQAWRVGKGEICWRNSKLFSVSKHIYFCSNLAQNDLKFFWHNNSEFQKSHSTVILQGLLWSVSLLSFPCMLSASGLCLEGIPPKSQQELSGVTSVLSLRLQIICTFSEYHSLALDFLRREGNENPRLVRRHMLLLSWAESLVPASSAGSAHFTQWNKVEFYSARDEITLQEPD